MELDCSIYLAAPGSDDIAAAIAAWRSRAAVKGALALMGEADADHLPRLQAAARDAGLPLVGAIFPELIVDAEFRPQGVLLLGLSRPLAYEIFPEIIAGEDAQADAVDGIIALVDRTLGKKNNATLFLLFDAMVPSIASILEEIHLNLSDRVHYMGVNAGSESFQPMPCLFDNEQLVQGGVIALILPDYPGAILEHGYKAPEHLVSTTSSQGNRIITIDWRPAFEVYAEQIKQHYGVTINKDNFYQYAVHFPFGIIRMDQEVLVRIPVALEDDGSLFCVGEVPENATLTLLQAVPANANHTVDKLADVFSEMATPAVLTFYCAGRRMHLGDAAARELAALAAQLEGRQVMGALSLGEIGSSQQDGYPLFHNATLVCGPWG